MIKQWFESYYGYYVPVIFFVSMVILFLIFFPPNADAATRAETSQMKVTLAKMRQDLVKFDEDIKKQQQVILDKEKEIDVKKDALRKKKQSIGESYDAYVGLHDAEQAVKDAQKAFEDAKNKLQELLTNKNLLFVNIQKLETQINENEKEIIRTQRTELDKFYKIIGVKLSNSCITMIKINNPGNTCPDYKLLQTLDSSNVDVSGQFKEVNGFYQRDKAPVSDSWRWYDHDDQIRIIVDPPQGMEQRIRMIEIKPNFGTYLLADSMVQKPKYEYVDIEVFNKFKNKTETITIKNQTQTFATIIFHDRYIADCKKAVINADKWKMLLPDTIHHMRSDCSENSTSFVEKEIIQPNVTEFNLKDSAWYQYEQWLVNVTKHCIFKYRACT